MPSKLYPLMVAPEILMNDYSMSDDLFRQRALEEDSCMIAAVGAGLVRAMNFDGGSVSLSEQQRRLAWRELFPQSP